MSEIDKPDHYAPIGGVYPIDITEHLPHCLAAAIEYLWRAGKKPGQDATKDYAKAAWYLARQVDMNKHMTVTGSLGVNDLARTMAFKAMRDRKSDLTGPLPLLLTAISCGLVPAETLATAIVSCRNLANIGAAS